MKEIRDILQAFFRAQQEGKRCALATVVKVEGSSYRRPGARMLVTEDGQLTGAISGGCLEGDALRKAMFAIYEQTSKLVTYDSMDEDDLQFGIQLGCNGIVYILFEPIFINEPHNPIHLLQELVYERRNAVLTTLFSLDRNQAQPGTTLLVADGLQQTKLTDPLRSELLADSREVFWRKTSAFKEYVSGQERYTGFLEFVTPPPALVIAGAGNDVMPLVEIAHLIGWHTTVADGRPHYATTQRFPKADRVLVAKPGELLQKVAADEQTVFLLMTHNYPYDMALLKELLVIDCPYIGLLGPRKKLERMIDELRRQGIQPDAAQLAALHGPVGLDIGAETAQEIAVCIVAEIKRCLSSRSGAALKDITHLIHSRPNVDLLHA